MTVDIVVVPKGGIVGREGEKGRCRRFAGIRRNNGGVIERITRQILDCDRQLYLAVWQACDDLRQYFETARYRDAYLSRTTFRAICRDQSDIEARLHVRLGAVQGKSVTFGWSGPAGAASKGGSSAE